MILKPPLPWFGGKRRVAHLVWQRFGNVQNYVEPFAGSLAVLLGRLHAPKVETVNDKDCYLSNFWRALIHDSVGVAHYADWPVNEADLHARHRWLINQHEFIERMKTEPDYYDAKIAGWWVWGLSAWIGGGWCKLLHNRMPEVKSGRGINAQRPNLRPGQGVNNRQLPHLNGDAGAAGTGIFAKYIRTDLHAYMHALASRLRRVRVVCGDWLRVTGKSVTWKIGTTGMLLDAPYKHDTGRDDDLYNHESATIADDVREWAIAEGENPKMRIALCGYEGEHDMPNSWDCVAWKAKGGYANQRKNGTNDNAQKERIWFSPHCLKPVENGLKRKIDYNNYNDLFAVEKV